MTSQPSGAVADDQLASSGRPVAEKIMLTSPHIFYFFIGYHSAICLIIDALKSYDPVILSFCLVILPFWLVKMSKSPRSLSH